MGGSYQAIEAGSVLRREEQHAEGKPQCAPEVLKPLIARGPEQILGQIVEGDPLGLQQLCMRHLRENGLIIDPDRTFEASLDEVAFAASQAKPGDVNALWLEDRVEDACRRILLQDREEERLARQGVAVDSDKHHFVSEAFGVPWGEGRRVSVRFHDLPKRARQAFMAVCVERVPVHEYLETMGSTREVLREDIWDVFCALGHISPEELAEVRVKKSP